MRMLSPTLHCDGQLLVEMTGTVERFKALTSEVMLMGGSKGLACLKQTMYGLEQALPNVKRIEFSRLGHDGPCE